ncbi:MAG: glycosyltransferase [Bdellovibrionales bacterium]
MQRQMQNVARWGESWNFTCAEPILERILMTTDTVGGVWHYSLDMARGLAEYGVCVHLATMGKNLTPHQAAEAGAIPNLQIHESSFKLEWMEEPWTEVDAAGLWLLSLARELQPNVIHFNHFCSAHLPFNAPKLVVAHSDVLSWWRSVLNCEAPDAWDIYRTRVACGLRAADSVVAPTETMLKSVQSDFGPLPRCKVIPNGRSSFGASIDAFTHKAKEPFVLSLGRIWDPAKNFKLLNEVAPSLPWPVVAAGQSEDLLGHQEPLSNLKLIGEVSPDSVCSYMQRAAIYALPAKYEPFGLSVLEAAYRRCALVLGDIASLRENWEGAALFVNPDDGADIRNALRRLIEDPDLREQLGSRAQSRARNLTVTRMVSEYMREYVHLVNSARHYREIPK